MRENKVLLFGEHSKGHAEPFSELTLSGKRLRKILSGLDFNYDLDNVFDLDMRRRDLVGLCAGKTVVALGRVAQRELRRQGVEPIYLPHPASRSRRGLDALKAGLECLREREELTREQENTD